MTQKKQSKVKRSTSRNDGFGILNAYGDLWTPQVWGSEHEAELYLEKKIDEYTKNGSEIALRSHQVVPVKIVYQLPKTK